MLFVDETEKQKLNIMIRILGGNEEIMEKTKIKVAILAIASLVMISLTASAILAEIQMHFEYIDGTFITLVLTIPPLLGVVFAFVSGPLSMKFSKKSIVIFGLTSGLIGGMLSFLLGPTNFKMLLFSSVLIGKTRYKKIL